MQSLTRHRICLVAFRSIGAACCLLLSTACRREEIAVYSAPKDAEPPRKAAASTLPDNHPSPAPSLKWSALPEGWRSVESANSMRVASFTVEMPDRSRGEVSAVAIPGMNGDDLQFVNLWREQVKLPPIEAAEVSKFVEAASIAGGDGKLFTMENPPAPGAASGAAVLVGMLVKDEFTWFFKFSGDDKLIQGQRSVFKDFLKGLSFGPPRVVETAATDAPFARGGTGGGAGPGRGGVGASQALPTWKTPASWQKVAAGQMVLAKFSAPGATGGSADISISSFPGDVGGLLANVNRWRGIMSLPKVDADGLSSAVSPIDLSEGKGTVVDFAGTDSKTGQPGRLVGVIVPHGNETWFYKMTGSPEASEREKAAFLQFVQSAQYSHAP